MATCTQMIKHKTEDRWTGRCCWGSFGVYRPLFFIFCSFRPWFHWVLISAMILFAVCVLVLGFAADVYCRCTVTPLRTETTSKLWKGCLPCFHGSSMYTRILFNLIHLVKLTPLWKSHFAKRILYLCYMQIILQVHDFGLVSAR